MAISNIEKEIYRRGKERGDSDESIKQAVLKYRQMEAEGKVRPPVEDPVPAEAPKETYLTDYKKFVPDVGKGIKESAKQASETITKMSEGELNPLAGGLAFTGDIAKGVSNTISDVLLGAGKAVLPKAAEEKIQQAFTRLLNSDIGVNVMELPEGFKIKGKSAKEIWTDIKEKAPQTAEAIEGIANIGALVTDVYLGGKGGKKGLEVAAEAADTAKATGKMSREAVESGLDDLQDLWERSTRGGMKVAGERKAIEKAERLAEQNFIQSLPPVEKKAAQFGVQPDDIKFFSNTLDDVHSPYVQEMVDVAQDFGVDQVKNDPAKVVGRVIQDKIRDLEELKKVAGKELETVAKNLPRVQSGALAVNQSPHAMKASIGVNLARRLMKTPGFEGVSFDPKTLKLNFDDTRLSFKLLDKDKKILQKAFDDIISSKDPYQLHKKRQGAFDYIRGKKQTFEINDVQRNGIEAMRKGAADILNKFDAYSDANWKYKKIVNPLNDVNSWFKDLPDASDDLLEMRGGLLARRVTSNAQSKPQIIDYLNNIDQVLRDFNKKSAEVSVEKLQESLNRIAKYYNIKGDTSLGGILGNTIDFPTTRTDLVNKMISKVFGLEYWSPSPTTAKEGLKILVK